MKQIILGLMLFLFIACKSAKANPNEVIITSKNERLANDYSIVINKIVSDSRCPIGTNCIWAGELVMELSVLKSKKMIETVVLTFSPTSKTENMAWFEKYIPNNKKLIKYQILPYKTEKNLELKDYKMELILE
jgi:hypothetical protein